MSKSPQNVMSEQQHFDALAKTTGEIWWGSTTPAGIERLKRRALCAQKLLAAYQNPSVLELGCGTGAFSKYLLEEIPYRHIYGIDISPECIALAQKRYHAYPFATFTVGDVTHLGFSSHTFDAVLGNSILHHVPLAQTLNEALRVLKPGGLFYFYEPNMLNPQIAIEKNIHWIGKRLQNSDDETAFIRWQLAHALKKVGFTRVSVQPYDFLHPATPKLLVPIIKKLTLFLEHLPLVREIAGSLSIHAYKP